MSNKKNSTPGKNPTKVDAIGAAMRVLSTVAGSDFAEKYGLRKPVDRVTYQATKTGFKTLGAANRSFKKVSGGNKPNPLPDTPRTDLFDLSLGDEQKMIQETVRDFATDVMRPAAHDADEAAKAPEPLVERSAEIGVTMINVPEEYEGVATERGVVTNSLVAEALAYGDMGLALPILAPSSVAATLSQFGSESQQKTYLPAFGSENVPGAVVVVNEPTPMFNPFELTTKAKKTSGGYSLTGVKSLVPIADSAELFIVAAEYEGAPAFFIVESDTDGLVVEADPSMGLRAAGIGRINLNEVNVPAEAILGGETSAEDRNKAYRDIIRLSRLGWASLSVGTSQAVLDYVIPYVKEREAFGEPIAHRQAVAFMVADIATELDGMRLVTWRGASRAEQGEDFAREAALARKLATDKGMKIGLDGVQLLGGHGFTKEHPVERWYRDLRAAGVAEGVVVL
ncbi:acyl-CoA dehydrogenase family protein [Dietzia timorensis]|uniref:Putative medium-chain specific acyl-CoA dehydrogen ase 10, mitochondrial n=1 Tax=Dietzia timorensis TaxID=499555 RepID=A0A173LKN7_9ACTN|nr:acyl-CoA dehydrogenase family protein [Dietzia timorensis]ANI91867.1 putative medium-chain specific acyl-CoA dehydrogen ase 10, mitochondrial [Dietzia timorensis]